jgi:hypothetical protein
MYTIIYRELDKKGERCQARGERLSFWLIELSALASLLSPKNQTARCDFTINLHFST